MNKETSTEKILTKVSALERDQVHLAESLNNHAQILSSFKTDVLSEFRALREGQKGPNIVAFSGWASVILVIIISIGGLSLAPMRSQLAKLDNNQQMAMVRLMQNGWSKDDQIRFKKDFDDILQREMRLLDEVLQREMHLNDKIIDTKLMALAKRFDLLESAFSKHDKEYAAVNGRQSAYIQDLKESLAEIKADIKPDRYARH